MSNSQGGRSWTTDEDRQLLEMVAREVPRAVVSKTLQRTVAAIVSRLKILRDQQTLTVAQPKSEADIMHPAAEPQFSRAVREYARWRAVPEAERSPAPAWWWQPAFEVREQQELMSPIWCHHLELPHGSTYAAGAAVLLGALADQKSLPWPDEFPRRIERTEKPDETNR